MAVKGLNCNTEEPTKYNLQFSLTTSQASTLTVGFTPRNLIPCEMSQH